MIPVRPLVLQILDSKKYMIGLYRYKLMTKEPIVEEKRKLNRKMLEILISISVVIAVILAVMVALKVSLIHENGVPSEWIALIIDMIIILILAILSKKEEEKLADVLFQIKNLSEIQANIIKEQEVLRQRRREYAISEIKNHFTTIFLILGLANRKIMEFNKKPDERVKLKQEIDDNIHLVSNSSDSIKSILSYSIDVLEPTLIEEIISACQIITNIKITQENNQLQFPYDDIKKRIYRVIEKFPGNKLE